MPADVGAWPSISDGLCDHWTWRPEWHQDRPCLYWYLTFDKDAVAAALGSEMFQAVRQASWLDPVPLEWTHLTLCDLGFPDEVPKEAVGRALQSMEDVLAEGRVPELELGPMTGLVSAVVLAAEPLDRLRQLQYRVRAASTAALGPGAELVHRHQFWPHVSLGYVNRKVTAGELRALTDAFGHVRVCLPVDGLALAAVTRRARHYQWSVVRAAPTAAALAAPAPGGR